MSSKQRTPLARARIIAGEVVDLLSSVCERIEVAGSVRREKAFVGDIEILCAPRVRHETQMDLFGQATGPMHTYSELDELCTRLLADKRLSYRLNAVGHRAGWGERNKLAWYHPQDGSQPIPLDIFTVYPDAGEQWGVAQVIRTGPKEVKTKSSKLLSPGQAILLANVELGRQSNESRFSSCSKWHPV